mgnify:FL=1
MKRARQRWERRLRIMRINLIGFLILAVVGCAGFRMVRTVLLQNAQELGSSLAGTSASEARNKLTVYETLLSFGAEMVSSRLESWTGAEDVSAWMGRYFQQLEAILGEGNADLYGVIGGEIVAANPWEGDRTYDYTQAEWYQRALESDGGVAFTNVYQDAIYGRPVITISRTCGQEGDVLAMDVFPENFGFQDTGLSLPEGASFFLCDQMGTLIYQESGLTHSGEEIQAYLDRLLSAIRRGEMDHYDTSAQDLDGKERGVYYAELPNGWVSIITIPYESILGGLHQISAGFLLLLGISLLLLALLTWRDLRASRQMERTNETVRVLSNSYYALYRVDFGKGTYEMIKGSDYMRSRVGPTGRYEDLLECMMEVIEADACQEYRESFSLENIRRLVSGRVRDFGGDFLRRFGEEYRWVSVRVLYDESLAPEEAVLCFREVDQEKSRQLQERRLLESSLEAARQSAQSKQAFFSNMSHDMRTPLNAIIGLTELAEKAAEDPDKVREYLRRVELSSRQLLELINDILDMSRMEHGTVEMNLREFDLKTCIGDCAEAIRFQAEQAGKTFRLRFDVERSTVLGDPFRVSQIMNNLLSNALKFTAPGDTISLEVTQIEHQEYAKYKIVVADTGIGMAQDFLPRLFEPYARESRFEARQVKGTGLGMAIVKSLVEQMNGHIHVESAQGEGSTFTVILPFETVEDSRPASAPAPAPAQSWSLEGRRVLLAEDNEINMEIATELLTMRGVQVTQAWNGREAVERFQASEPNAFDVILMDMQMPEMDGCEAAERIRALPRPDAGTVPIIAVTANAFAEDIAATTKAGMDAHISKPIDFRILCQTMEKLLEERRS